MKKGIPIILAIVGGAGVVATAVVTAMDTPKASQALKELKKSKEKLKPIDYVKWIGKNYWKSLVIGGASIASITSSTVISQKHQASLAATCMLLKSGYDRYKGKVKEVLGVETHKDILKAIAREDVKKVDIDDSDGRKIYYEEHIGTFLAEPTNVALAYADMNQHLHCDEYGRSNNWEVTLYDFLTLCKAELINEQDKSKNTKDIPKAFNNFGWSIDYLGDNFEYYWIHMNITEDPGQNEGDPHINHIYFLEDPILLPYDEKNDTHDGRTEIYYPKEGAEPET